MTRRYNAIVLGGGVAGLAAALRLAERGTNTLVIEKEEHPGGMCRSIRSGKFIFDLGGHRFLPRSERVRKLVDGLFEDGGLSWRSRKSQIHLGGRLLYYPPRVSDVCRQLGAGACTRCLLDGVAARLKSLVTLPSDESLETWLLRRFGRKLYEIYFGPYSAKLWGTSPSNISSEWAPRRIPVSSIVSAIRHTFCGMSGHSPYAYSFLYPAGGIGEIPRRMAAAVSRGGGHIRTGHTVVGVSVLSDGFAVETESDGGRQEEFLCETLISTVPLPELACMLRPELPEAVLAAATHLRFRSVRFLNLMFCGPTITENNWLYVPEERFTFFRIQEFVNWHPKNVPPGMSSLLLEIACEQGDALWCMDEEELLSRCLEDLDRLGMEVPRRDMGSFSTYSQHAYPMYSLDYAENARAVRDYLGTVNNLSVCGRQGLFRYMDMDEAIETGLNAADQLSLGEAERLAPETYAEEVTMKPKVAL